MNPSLNDLIERKVYKLHQDGVDYYIPLWHNELHFNNEIDEFIVKCDPILPDHIDIDEQNNVVVNIKQSIQTCLNNGTIQIIIGNKPFVLQTDLLMIRSNQQHIIRASGIPRINEKQFDCDRLIGDIIVNITLV